MLDHESLVRQARHNPLDDHECGEAKDRKPPGVGYHDVTPIGQSFSLGNIEKEIHETFEQRPAKVVDVLSSADAVSVLRPEEDVAKLLWMRSTELNQAARCASGRDGHDHIAKPPRRSTTSHIEAIRSAE